MIMCAAGLEDFSPCDSIVNPTMIIEAITSVPARLRLASAFSFECTYIPFLIRWDLVPKWKPSNKESDDERNGDGNNGDQENPDDSSSNNKNPICKDKTEDESKKKENPFSALEQALIDGDKDGLNIVNSIRNDPENDVKPASDDDYPEPEERGVPVEKKYDNSREIDINSDFKLGKRIAEADTNADIISTKENSNQFSNDWIYHILEYGKDASDEKQKDFPFHTKRIVVND
jgi:hypothetical protein